MARYKCLCPASLQSSGPGAFQFLTRHNCSFSLSVVAVIFYCFVFSLSCLSTFFNNFASSFFVTGWSHVPLQNLTISCLLDLMLLLLFFFSSLSSSFAWFVWNILFLTYCCFCLDDVLINVILTDLLTLDDVATTFFLQFLDHYFQSSIS